MGKISVFNFLTVNGYYKGLNEDTSWHVHTEQNGEFAEQSLRADNILLFGRKTYDLMAAFWPTPAAVESLPEIAAGMNRAEKIVFSNTLGSADWNNSRVLSGDIAAQMKILKRSSGKNMTILGSGTIVSYFSECGLIDEYLLMLDPIALGSGTPLFSGMKTDLKLKLTGSTIFDSGVVMLSYVPANKSAP